MFGPSPLEALKSSIDGPCDSEAAQHTRQSQHGRACVFHFPQGTITFVLCGPPLSELKFLGQVVQELRGMVIDPEAKMLGEQC